MIATHAVPMTTAADLAKRQAWVEKCFTTAATLPLSFVLDEKKITGIPARMRQWFPPGHPATGRATCLFHNVSARHRPRRLSV